MGIEENKDVVRRFVAECINPYRPELLERLRRRRTSASIPAPRGPARTPKGSTSSGRPSSGSAATFPDLHIELDQLIGEGDLVAARWTATGTHSGALAGMPATGTAVRWGGTDMYRLSDGRIVEWWRNDDFVWLLHQVGRDLVPTRPHDADTRTTAVQKSKLDSRRRPCRNRPVPASLSRMRALFVASPMVGHVLPLMPLAAAFRDAGHDVLVATGADGVGRRAQGRAAGPRRRARGERGPGLRRRHAPASGPHPADGRAGTAAPRAWGSCSPP